MKDAKTVTKDPVCGMTVDKATALHADPDGKTVYFCSDKCREVFMALPDSVKEVES